MEGVSGSSSSTLCSSSSLLVLLRRGSTILIQRSQLCSVLEPTQLPSPAQAQSSAVQGSDQWIPKCCPSKRKFARRCSVSTQTHFRYRLCLCKGPHRYYFVCLNYPYRLSVLCCIYCTFSLFAPKGGFRTSTLSHQFWHWPDTVCCRTVVLTHLRNKFASCSPLVSKILQPSQSPPSQSF